MAWVYQCTDGYMRPLSRCKIVWDKTGRYWYVADEKLREEDEMEGTPDEVVRATLAKTVIGSLDREITAELFSALTEAGYEITSKVGNDDLQGVVWVLRLIQERGYDLHALAHTLDPLTAEEYGRRYA